MALSAKSFFVENKPNLQPDIRLNLEKEFFCSIKLSNGTFKTTWPNRFKDIDLEVIKYLQKQAAVKPKTFLDIGVSSGRSTYEWFLSLKDAGFQPKMKGTDLILTAYLIRICSGIYVLAEKNGHPLQFDLINVVIRSWNRRLDYFTGYFCLTIALKRIFKPEFLLKKIHYGEKQLKKSSCQENTKKIKLLSPIIREDCPIEFYEDDILAKNSGSFKRKYDMIRVCNLLNKGYFTLDQLRLGLKNIIEKLSGPGSYLLINRTVDAINHGALFRFRDDGRLESVLQLGKGSEIEDLVLEMTID